MLLVQNIVNKLLKNVNIETFGMSQKYSFVVFNPGRFAPGPIRVIVIKVIWKIQTRSGLKLCGFLTKLSLDIHIGPELFGKRITCFSTRIVHVLMCPNI